MNNSSWQHRELICLILYALVFYVIIIRRSLHLSHDHYGTLYGLRPGWIGGWYNDVSDAQWRNFRANLPILTAVFGIFTMVANMMRAFYHLKAKGISIVWLLISLAYLLYLHGACIIFVLSFAVVNFLLVKIFGKKKYFPFVLWGFNISVLMCNRVFEGYRFSSIGQHWAYLDNFRGTFRWHICFNFVTLRQISFGYDYHWACCSSRLDQKERNLQNNNFSLAIYLCYLVYAPLYIAGPVLSFNAFASQVLNFMWLKFSLIWRYFRFWSLISGIEAPENMPKCINNCYNLDTFWKSWHASFNKWLVRYMYIPLGGSQRKLLNVWVIFTFVAIWHDLEWKLLSWAWLTCIFFVPEMIVKSAATSFQAPSAFGEFVFRELSALAGAITITCLMVANLVGYVIGPSGMNWLISQFLRKEGLPTLGGMFLTLYVGTKVEREISSISQLPL
ncbi:hypothetical protein RHMOL_Rhmol01G0366100 [Rhododendron molle]|uniref:Uncharacterized protein n=1 Tax=Rhododendron molle TaxID=49168 RepID=A0ACC0Q9Z6_RHOML|nr:hypothetical protein RHMOL_Rhmol01G0366100 [Rhododendron molle]